MTAQVTELRRRADDEAAVLAMLRRDAVEYVTQLFDWIEEAGPGSAWALIKGCFVATEKNFHEVLTAMIALAEEHDEFNFFRCDQEIGCRCLRCRYPAEPPEDTRPPWTQLMDNIRLRDGES